MKMITRTVKELNIHAQDVVQGQNGFEIQDKGIVKLVGDYKTDGAILRRLLDIGFEDPKIISKDVVEKKYAMSVKHFVDNAESVETLDEPHVPSKD